MHKCFSKQYQSCKWDHATESQAFTKKENVLISPISLLFISIYKLLQHYIYFSLCYNADVPQLILILTLAGWTKPPPVSFSCVTLAQLGECSQDTWLGGQGTGAWRWYMELCHPRLMRDEGRRRGWQAAITASPLAPPTGEKEAEQPVQRCRGQIKISQIIKKVKISQIWSDITLEVQSQTIMNYQSIYELV